jgi:hypothetical protein
MLKDVASVRFEPDRGLPKAVRWQFQVFGEVFILLCTYSVEKDVSKGHISCLSG